MLKVISCLAYEHDYSFVAAAAIVCVMTSIMTVKLFDRAQRISMDLRLSWIMLSSVAGGAAIWTTHFVAMLGFQLPMDHAFDPVLTILSLLLAIGFTGLGLWLSVGGIETVPAEFGGVVIGLGIVAMHFTGMAGLETSARIEWDWSLITASILFAIGFGAMTTHLLARRSFSFSRPLAMVSLVLAICSLHFTAMGAATLVPDPSIPPPTFAMSNEFLAVLALAMMAMIAGLTLYVLDTRSQRELVDSFRYAALHDPLTGLPNRAYLSAHLSGMLQQSRGSGTQSAILVIDLDRFKEINDVHGHHTGDLLLQTLAARMIRHLLPGELITRVGGDEFIAIKPGILSTSDVDEFAHRLIHHIQQPVPYGLTELSVGASIGVSLHADCDQAEELIGRADLAMYRAKSQLEKKVCYYEPSMDERRRNRSALAMELRHAVERDEFELYYQPQLDMCSRQVTGYEALLHWNHRKRGIISPAEFIPIAEETGLIIPIGEWVLKTACAEAAKWDRPYRIAVNIASAQLTQANLTRTVHEILLATGLPASRLELEITEASIIEDHDRTLHVIRQLKALGVTITMDDYGTGYSSLSTLQTFPFDKLKIDRSFIEGLMDNETSAAIVKATIIMASSLKISVLAEGVERQEQAEFLQAQGCTEAQGLLFGRPRPLLAIAGEVGRSQTGNAKQAPRPRALPELQYSSREA